jgi:Na+-translocating ferredoxin:NAD+ oxidoreductase subunit B
LCVSACPTDAIMGSNKTMHTVIEPYCTGCELCLPVCPVDCIELENVTGVATGWAAWSQSQADLARDRYMFSRLRRQRSLIENDQRLEAQAKKRTVIEAALARARAQRNVESP